MKPRYLRRLARRSLHRLGTLRNAALPAVCIVAAVGATMAANLLTLRSTPPFSEQAHAQPTDDLVAELTNVQQQVLALQTQLERLHDFGGEGVTRSRFPTVGTLVRSVPDELVVRGTASDVSFLAARNWLNEQVVGRAVVWDLVHDRTRVSKLDERVDMRCVRSVESHREAPVAVDVECEFATRGIDRLVGLQAGDRIRVRGTVTRAFFSGQSSGSSGTLVLTLSHCELLDSPMMVRTDLDIDANGS